MKKNRVLTDLRNGCFLLLAMTLGSGCALTTDTINLHYTLQSDVAKIDGADSVRVAVTITDARVTKDKVSCKKNGYGMEMAPIISRDTVTTVVANAIAEELVNRGFTIQNGSVTVSIDLTKFYNDFKVGFISGSTAAEVACSIQVKNPNGNIAYARALIGLYSEDGIMLTSGDNAERALERALQDVVEQLMHDTSFIDAVMHAAR